MFSEVQFQSAVERVLRLTNLEAGDTPHATFLVDYTSLPAAYDEYLSKSNCNSNRSDHTAGILDILGFYRASDKTIILFAKAIMDCASHLKAREDDLRTIVIYHEVAHMVTHLGHGHGAGIWNSFSAASINEVEFYAQIYSHFALERIDRADLVDLLRQLAVQSPSPYQSYLSAIPCSVELVNGFLYADRGGAKLQYKMPPAFARGLTCALSDLNDKIIHDAPIAVQDLQLDLQAALSAGSITIGNVPVSAELVRRVRQAKDGV